MKQLTPFIPGWLDDAGLSPHEFRLLCHLYRRRNKASLRCDPSGATMAKVCRMSADTVWPVLKQLEAKGFLRRNGRNGRSNQYEIAEQPTGKGGVGDLLEKEGQGLPGKEGWHLLEKEGHEGNPTKDIKKVCGATPPGSHTHSLWPDSLPEEHASRILSQVPGSDAALLREVYAIRRDRENTYGNKPFVTFADAILATELRTALKKRTPAARAPIAKPCIPEPKCWRDQFPHYEKPWESMSEYEQRHVSEHMQTFGEASA